MRGALVAFGGVAVGAIVVAVVMLGRSAVVLEGVAVGIGATELVGKARSWQEVRESFREELT
eukprot:2166992-Alexandrium_andersonii.AAC.1